MARCGLVSPAQSDGRKEASSTEEIRSPSLSSSQTERNSSSPAEVEADGLALIRKKLKSKGLNNKLVKIMMNSWRPSTLNQYKVYLNKWIAYCNTQKIDPLKSNS